MPVSKTERDSPSLETGVSTEISYFYNRRTPLNYRRHKKESAATWRITSFRAIDQAGFTPANLAEHAGILLAGALAFLASPTGQQYAETVGKSDDGADTLFRLRTENRADLLQQITAICKEIYREENVPELSRDELFTTLDLLESTLWELESGSGSVEEREACLNRSFHLGE